MVSANVSLPPLFVTVTVYTASAVSAVGVPVTTPVPLANARPVGSVGDTLQLTTAPPLVVGELLEIATSFVYADVAAVYALSTGNAGSKEQRGRGRGGYSTAHA